MREDSAKQISNYKIKETLQESLEGALYRAVDQVSDRAVLIKVYYPSLIWSESLLLEFFKRVEYLRYIENDYLLPIVDFGKYHELPFVVYADDSLTLLSSHQHAHNNLQEALQFFQAVAEAVEFLHRQEIIHGTLNTDNIALDTNGNPRVFDFGLSAIFKSVLQENMDEGFQNLSVSNQACTSPEQLQGLIPTRSADIYSFGIVCYYYAFGELPQDLQSAPYLTFTQTEHPVIQTVKLPEAIPEAVLQFIEKCIQINPTLRFTNFHQALKALNRMMEGKKNRLHVQKRLAVKKRSGAAQYRVVLIGTAILLISLLGSLYSFLPHSLFAPVNRTATHIFTVSPTLQKTRPTPKPKSAATLAQLSPQSTNVSTETVQIPVQKRPAIENESPLRAAQPITLANLSALHEISRLGVGRPEELAASPDNTYIAEATSTGVYIFRANQLYTWIDPGNWATSVQFSLDGSTLAVGLVSGEIQLWDWNTGIQTATLTGHTGKINRILYSKIDRMYSASADGNIIVWNIAENYKAEHVIDAHSRPVNDIAVESDGRIIISCSDDGFIRVWDVASVKKLYEIVFSTEGSKPKAVALSPDDLYFAVGGESGYIYQWKLLDLLSVIDPHPNLRTDPIPVTKKIWSLQYIRDGAELLAGIEGGTTERYNSDRKDYPGVARNFQIAPPAKDLVDVFGPAFDFSSSAVMMGENIITSNWDGKVSTSQNQLVTPMYDILDRLDISKGGTILATGGKRETIHVWDLTTNRILYTDHFILPYGHPISPDGSTIAIMVPKEIKKSVTTGNLITEYFFKMRDLTGNQSSRDFSQAFPDQQVGYMLDGSIFVAGDLEHSTAWDYASGFETESKGYGTNEGCRLTASGNDQNQVLQVYSPMGAFAEWKEPYASHICQLAFRFGGTLAAFSDNLELFIRSKSKTILESYSVFDELVTWQYSNESEISALAISQDGKIVAFGDTSGKLVLINGQDGTDVMKIQGNFGAIRAIEFSQDSKIIVTSGDDGAVRVFGITD